jgi:mannose-6-phosphate isomerase-like protein (cupin superfamily)
MTARIKVNLAEKFGLFHERWSPKVVAQVNGNDVRIAKLEGEFVWHAHPDSDEAFLVVKGDLVIHLRDGQAQLHEGEMAVVPRGIKHKPEARREAHVLVIVRSEVVNTGDAGGERTAEAEWI